MSTNVRTVEPAWSYWQFPIERIIGTLPDLIGTHSEPYAPMVNAFTDKYHTKLITDYADAHTPQEWAEATGRPARGVQAISDGVYAIASTYQPGVWLVPPGHSPGPLTGTELERMREVLSLEGATDIPDQIMAKKYFCLKLA